MSEEMNQEQNVVDVEWEDGTTVRCEIYDVIDFEDKTYALLFPLSGDEVDDDEELIVMQYVEEGEEGYFQSIDDEDEFNKVCDYIQSLEEDDEEE
ncbi:DUF1292 domain-containing protein [bacterium]|nr:DUF1292 domain-containing protein [bacterium]